MQARGEPQRTRDALAGGQDSPSTQSSEEGHAAQFNDTSCISESLLECSKRTTGNECVPIIAGQESVRVGMTR